jgi:hypothetical protein
MSHGKEAPKEILPYAYPPYQNGVRGTKAFLNSSQLTVALLSYICFITVQFFTVPSGDLLIFFASQNK